MCFNKPSTPDAPPPLPTVTPTTMDQGGLNMRNRERRRQMARMGRASTILAGNQAPNQGVGGKTLLGS